MRYHERFCDMSQSKWVEYVDALRGGIAILTTDRVIAEDIVVFENGEEVKRPSFERSGFVAIFRISDVQVLGNDLTFDLVERVEDLR